MKAKDDPNIILKGQSKRVDVAMKALSDEMKINVWISMQGIKNEKNILFTMAQVKA